MLVSCHLAAASDRFLVVWVPLCAADRPRIGRLLALVNCLIHWVVVFVVVGSSPLQTQGKRSLKTAALQSRPVGLAAAGCHSTLVVGKACLHPDCALEPARIRLSNLSVVCSRWCAPLVLWWRLVVAWGRPRAADLSVVAGASSNSILGVGHSTARHPARGLAMVLGGLSLSSCARPDVVEACSLK